MAASQADSAVDIQAWFEQEIPCQKCSNPAQLRSMSHPRCTERPGPPIYSCIDCWRPWLVRVSKKLAKQGRIQCMWCNGRFGSVEEFSDFKEF